MDYEALPNFCKREGSGSSNDSSDGVDCYSYDHPFHQELYNYIKQQALNEDFIGPIKQGSMHVDVPTPDLEEAKIMETIESELHKFSGANGLSHSFNRIKIEGPWCCPWSYLVTETTICGDIMLIHLQPQGTYGGVIALLACNL